MEDNPNNLTAVRTLFKEFTQTNISYEEVNNVPEIPGKPCAIITFNGYNDRVVYMSYLNTLVDQVEEEVNLWKVNNLEPEKRNALLSYLYGQMEKSRSRLNYLEEQIVNGYLSSDARARSLIGFAAVENNIILRIYPSNYTLLASPRILMPCVSFRSVLNDFAAPLIPALNSFVDIYNCFREEIISLDPDTHSGNGRSQQASTTTKKFGDFLLNDPKDKLLKFLIKEYSNPKNPRDIVYMLYALKDLNKIDVILLTNFSMPELLRLLSSTFGKVGTRQSLGTSIKILKEADATRHAIIMSHRTLIKKALQNNRVAE